LILPDVNVLIYAFRVDTADHSRYREWLEEVVNGPATFGLAPHILSAVVRVCTHPRIFAVPNDSAEVFEFTNALIGQPNATLVQPGDRHWSLFQQICRDSRAMGNLIPDAWNAALAIESGCEWITTDRDYTRFKGLKWRTPF
jgi:toxin-antitoxin system PIN domain toxin